MQAISRPFAPKVLFATVNGRELDPVTVYKVFALERPDIMKYKQKVLLFACKQHLQPEALYT